MFQPKVSVGCPAKLWYVISDMCGKTTGKRLLPGTGDINSNHKQIPWTVRVQWSGRRWSSENMRRYTSPQQEWHRAHPSQRGEERSTFSQISEGNLTYKLSYTTSHPMNIKVSMNLVPSHLQGPSCSLREFITGTTSTDRSMFGPQNGHRKPRHPNHLMQLHPPSGPGDLVVSRILMMFTSSGTPES